MGVNGKAPLSEPTSPTQCFFALYHFVKANPSASTNQFVELYERYFGFKMNEKLMQIAGKDIRKALVSVPGPVFSLKDLKSGAIVTSIKLIEPHANYRVLCALPDRLTFSQFAEFVAKKPAPKKAASLEAAPPAPQSSGRRPEPRHEPERGGKRSGAPLGEPTAGGLKPGGISRKAQRALAAAGHRASLTAAYSADDAGHFSANQPRSFAPDVSVSSQVHASNANNISSGAAERGPPLATHFTRGSGEFGQPHRAPETGFAGAALTQKRNYAAAGEGGLKAPRVQPADWPPGQPRAHVSVAHAAPHFAKPATPFDPIWLPSVAIRVTPGGGVGQPVKLLLQAIHRLLLGIFTCNTLSQGGDPSDDIRRWPGITYAALIGIFKKDFGINLQRVRFSYPNLVTLLLGEACPRLFKLYYASHKGDSLHIKFGDDAANPDFDLISSKSAS